VGELNDWKIDAFILVEEAAKIARASQNRKIAEAAAMALDVMATDGIVPSASSQHYAMVMDELIASGALRLSSTVAEVPRQRPH
jgi:hypothetical protein